MSGEAISCYLSSTCSAVSCCLDVARLQGRSVEVALDFSQCGNYLDITVEQITVNHYLNNFTFGMPLIRLFVCLSICLSLCPYIFSVSVFLCLSLSLFELCLEETQFSVFIMEGDVCHIKQTYTSLEENIKTPCVCRMLTQMELGGRELIDYTKEVS